MEFCDVTSIVITVDTEVNTRKTDVIIE